MLIVCVDGLGRTVWSPWYDRGSGFLRYHLAVSNRQRLYVGLYSRDSRGRGGSMRSRSSWGRLGATDWAATCQHNKVKYRIFSRCLP
jgi:hypothetical protein